MLWHYMCIYRLAGWCKSYLQLSVPWWLIRDALFYLVQYDMSSLLFFSPRYCTSCIIWWRISEGAQTAAMRWETGQCPHHLLLLPPSPPCTPSAVNYRDGAVIDHVAGGRQQAPRFNNDKRSPQQILTWFCQAVCLWHSLRTHVIVQVFSLLITTGRYISTETTINNHSCVQTI